MLNRLKRKREITELEKTEIIIEYLKEKLEAYTEHYQYDDKISPTKLIEIILDYEVRKHFFMTNKNAWHSIEKEILKEEA
jgi:hypothetical protein